LQKEGDADGGADGEEHAYGVAGEIEESEFGPFGHDLEAKQQGETGRTAAPKHPPELPFAESCHLPLSADCALGRAWVR